MKKEEERGQILYYRPYPPEVYRKRLSKFSIILRWLLVFVVISALIIIFTQAEAEEYQCWVLCKPKAYVNLRMDPRKDGKVVGRMDCGDSFLTDGKNKNGFLHVLDAGECDCWIYGGFVVQDKPEAINQRYTVVAREQVACRRWVNGPHVVSCPWLKNGVDVSVFYIAGDWAVTSRGYIKSEWLELSPY